LFHDYKVIQEALPTKCDAIFSECFPIPTIKFENGKLDFSNIRNSFAVKKGAA